MFGMLYFSLWLEAALKLLYLFWLIEMKVVIVFYRIKRFDFLKKSVDNALTAVFPAKTGVWPRYCFHFFLL